MADKTTNAAAENRELSIEQREVEGLSQGRIVWRRFVNHKGAMISAVVLALVIITAYSSIGVELFGVRIPGWWIYSHTELNSLVNRGNPTLSFWPFSIGEHPFGQDEIGRDIFARVMRGTQQSLVVAFLIGGIASVIGVVVGSVAGFYRGWVDSILMRLTDVVITIPVLVIGAVLGRAVGGMGAAALGLFLGLVTWTGLARLVRGEFLTLREREFVDSARVAGASDSRIIFRHVLPNSVGVVIVNATLLISSAILLEAALSFLGFGIRPPDVSLGQLINEYQAAFNTRPWLFWWPGMFIIVIALSVNFIGDGLRDAFDPRQRKMPTTGGPLRQLIDIVRGRRGNATRETRS